MEIKIIKQFGAAIAAVCILYGAVATTYNSYEKVLAAQVDTPAIVTKETTSEASAETTTSAGAVTCACAAQPNSAAEDSSSAAPRVEGEKRDFMIRTRYQSGIEPFAVYHPHSA